MKSNPPASTQRVEGAGAELAHLRLDGVHRLRREHARQQAAVQVVDRRVFHEDQAGRDVEAGHDRLERRSLARAVGVPVDEGLLDVVVAAQRVEVELLVAVERRLVAHPLPERVRILVDLVVERVVVDVAVVRDRHGTPSFLDQVAITVVRTTQRNAGMISSATHCNFSRYSVSDRVGGGGTEVHVTPISWSCPMASIVACFPWSSGARPRSSSSGR